MPSIDLVIRAAATEREGVRVVVIGAPCEVRDRDDEGALAIEAGEALMLTGARRRILLKRFSATPKGWRSTGAAVVRALASQRLNAASLDTGSLAKDEIVALIDGALVEAAGGFDARTKRSERSEAILTLIGNETLLTELISVATRRANAVTAVRHLVGRPGNDLTPVRFRREAAVNDDSICVRIIDAAALKAMAAGAICAVGRGSVHPPAIVLLEYRGRPEVDAIDLGLVGKGVTFDAGGINLKITPALHLLKFDMAGAAVVLETLRLAAARSARLNIVVALALAENVQSGRAYRPGDVLTALNGMTIEVANTDAEGRLILADAMTLMEREYAPATLIDVATLTGSAADTLGEMRAALLTPSEGLSRELMTAGDLSGEALWPLPMGEEYDHVVRSTVADVRNCGLQTFLGNGFGNSIAGAKFLQRFVETAQWAHLDITPTAWSSGAAPGSTEGATGFGVRLLDTFIAQRESALAVHS